MSKVTHTANDFTSQNRNAEKNTLSFFFYGWDADGAPVEEYPEKINTVKSKKNDTTK